MRLRNVWENLGRMMSARDSDLCPQWLKGRHNHSQVTHNTGPRQTDELEGIVRRHAKRFSKQPKTVDLLPPVSCSTNELLLEKVPPTTKRERIKGRRSDMSVQFKLLRRSHSGKSKLELYHAISIAYLRRDTPHTDKALSLFRKFWTETGTHLACQLDTRWIISALQTFYDHGSTEGERSAGGIGFMYGNMIKVYETEYNALTQGKTVQYRKFRNRSFPTMYGFKPGDDILININTLAYDAALKGDLASEPLLELLTRAKRANTIFQRMDALHEVEEYSAHPTYTLSFDGRIKRKPN